jgi:hypothetical protein
VARRPANTRGTFSLQIGMTTAVRVPGAIAPSRAAVREIACLSPPLAITKNPASAVQNPIDTHVNRIANSTRIATSSGSWPW